MIIYLDASALVKRYILEAGSAAVESLLEDAEMAGTSIISKAEVSAAICKAARIGIVDHRKASIAVKRFRAHWPDLFRLKVDSAVVENADLLSWEHQLRGYDAVHLACAKPLTLTNLEWGVKLFSHQEILGCIAKSSVLTNYCKKLNNLL